MRDVFGLLRRLRIVTITVITRAFIIKARFHKYFSLLQKCGRKYSRNCFKT